MDNFSINFLSSKNEPFLRLSNNFTCDVRYLILVKVLRVEVFSTFLKDYYNELNKHIILRRSFYYYFFPKLEISKY